MLTPIYALHALPLFLEDNIHVVHHGSHDDNNTGIYFHCYSFIVQYLVFVEELPSIFRALHFAFHFIQDGK